jgi:penicillin-binding protein 1A
MPAGGRTRLKRLRFVAILLAVLLLGSISFVFGMFMAVASDLPSLEDGPEYQNARNSVLFDDRGRQLAVLSRQDQILVTASQIPPVVKNAVIAIEDKRFRTNSGIDVRGIARAFFQDILHKGAVQGASTIEQQFVKNALRAQAHRTIFEKLREAALAYQLAHRWSKEKILTEYLNTIYFGNGAYGIESAARTYFGSDVNHLGCGTLGHKLCVEELEPWEAALLAAVIKSPTYYDPVTHPQAARARRNLVLHEMLAQGYLSPLQYSEALAQALPAPKDVQLPHDMLAEGIDAGYFTSWVEQQVIERYGDIRAFDGGLQIRTTLDINLQRAAERAIDGYLPGPEGPTASLVAIENSTGEVRAMVGGRSYDSTPFNIATEGERQPGSSFKAFDLAAALEDGISPNSVWSSRVKEFVVPGTAGRERFVVHNDEGNYSGSTSLIDATAYSDNSVYAEVGLKVGTHKIARLAQRMGITTPISTNPAMTIGGLQVGVTPLDMAHAYETIARGGQRIGGSFASGGQPVGIQEVGSSSLPLPDGHHRDINRVSARRVLPPWVAQTETSMLETVLQFGTARSAALGGFAAGKTGTTSNYGDAWFVGWNDKYTVAVWVGYPTKLVPMTTQFNGQPVLGGTFPALIWHDFMVGAIQIEQQREYEWESKRELKLTAGANRKAGEAREGAGEGQGNSEAGAGAGHRTHQGPAEEAGPRGGSQGSGSGSAGVGAPGSSGAAGGGQGRESQPSSPSGGPSSPVHSESPQPGSGSSGAPKSGGAEATGGVSPGG